jgi:hypothetical protein
LEDFHRVDGGNEDEGVDEQHGVGRHLARLVALEIERDGVADATLQANRGGDDVVAVPRRQISGLQIVLAKRRQHLRRTARRGVFNRVEDDRRMLGLRARHP